MDSLSRLVIRTFAGSYSRQRQDLLLALQDNDYTLNRNSGGQRTFTSIINTGTRRVRQDTATNGSTPSQLITSSSRSTSKKGLVTDHIAVQSTITVLNAANEPVQVKVSLALHADQDPAVTDALCMDAKSYVVQVFNDANLPLLRIGAK